MWVRERKYGEARLRRVQNWLVIVFEPVLEIEECAYALFAVEHLWKRVDAGADLFLDFVPSD